MIRPKKIPMTLCSYAGLSIEKDGRLKLRYSNIEGGCHKVKRANIKLVKLPAPMNRREAISYACELDYFTEEEQDYMIDKLDEFAGLAYAVKRKPIAIDDIRKLPNSIFDLARSMGL